MTVNSYWHVWKWGLLTVLFFIIAAFFSWQYSWMSQYNGMRAERAAGLSAVYPPSTIMPAMVAAETQTATQASDGLMIIRTVSLSLAASRLDDLRHKIDDVVRRSRGYIDALTVRSDLGLARSLSATLRIPSERLQSAIEELKTLGTLTEESENSRDTTSGYTDLVARLSNARRTEQRLLGLLSERAGKLGEVVQVEKEVGEVRERIERMEAQQRGLQNQVQFATIRLELTEEGQSQYAGLGRRVRTAFTDGYRNAISTALDLTLDALRYGPSVVVYGVLLCPFIIVAYRRWGPRRMAS